jgi:GNAT superfamily N-acetyltransferase
MQVRPAQDDDATAIAMTHVRSWQATYEGLLPQSYLETLDVAQRQLMWQQILSETDWPRTATFVAELDTQVVGFASVCPTRDDGADPNLTGEVPAIYLLPDAWGRGLGRQLMIAALGSLREADFTDATLWVLDTNHRATRFYEAGGWRPDGATSTELLNDVALTEVRYRRRLQ